MSKHKNPDKQHGGTQKEDQADLKLELSKEIDEMTSDEKEKSMAYAYIGLGLYKSFDEAMNHVWGIPPAELTKNLNRVTNLGEMMSKGFDIEADRKAKKMNDTSTESV